MSLFFQGGWVVNFPTLSHCQAQPQLNSTQFQLQLSLSWFYFQLIQLPTHQATHPPLGKV